MVDGGLHAEFDTFIPMGTKEAKAVSEVAVDVIFKTYSLGSVQIEMSGFTTSSKCPY